MRTVQLIVLDAGGGHRAAARAIESVVRLQHRAWRVEVIDLSAVLRAPVRGRDRAIDAGRIDKAPTVRSLRPEDFYNRRLARGWTWGMKHELRLLQAAIRVMHPWLLRVLRQHWEATQPDLVVSLIPNFNRALRESLGNALPGVPYLTVMTDLADCPPRFWIEPGTHQHVACGTSRAYTQALAAGLEPWQLTRVSGMVLRADFYEPPVRDRAAARAALGLAGDRPTGFVTFGGWGSAQMLAISRSLPHVPLVLLCGRNAALAEQLREQRSQFGLPHVVLDYTDRVCHYMDLCDFAIGKPGPGSMSEALQRGLPVVTWTGASTMPQERYNVQWLLDQGVAVVVDSPRRVRAGVEQMIDRLPAYAKAVRDVENHAVYEVVDLIERLLGESRRVTQMRPVREYAPFADQWLPAA